LALCITAIAATAAVITAHNIRSSRSIGEEDIISPDMASSIWMKTEIAVVTCYRRTVLKMKMRRNTRKGIRSSKADRTCCKSESPGKSKTFGQASENRNINKTENKDEKTQNTKSSGKTESKSANKSEGKTESGKKVTFVMPVYGEVTFEYAMDRLVYSKTLDEWRAHSGVDLRADRGTPVKVVADGVVTEVKNDPRFGVTVLLSTKTA